MFDPRLQTAHMDLVERHRSDPGHEPPEPTDIMIDASLMMVINHEFAAACSKVLDGLTP
jgi:hypothetical protein